MPTSPYDHLDDLLSRLHTVRQHPSWRRRLFEGDVAVASVPVLRALRAVEQRENSGTSACVGDVAEYMAVDHSTASRLVTGVVDAGLLTKSLAAEDQRRCVLALTDRGREALGGVTRRRQQMVAAVVADWPDDDVERLLTLLDRLTQDFERGKGR